MATLTPQRIAITGLVPVLAAAGASGDAVKPSPTTFLWVANAHATDPFTVTLDDPTSVSPVEANDFDPDVVVNVPALSFKLIPVPARFRDPNTGLASWTYDDETDLTVGAFYLPSGKGAPATSGAITAATQRIVQAGLAPTFTNAAASQKVRPGARNFLLVRNLHNADHTITLDDPTTAAALTRIGIPPASFATALNPDVTVNVANATDYSFIGPVDGRFSDPADGYRGDITWSATTSMSYAALAI